MKVKVQDLKAALLGIEADRQLSQEIVEAALVEALSKAYRKHVETPDAYVNVVIDDGHIHIYPQRMVVEEVVDDALELSLEDALQFDENAKIGEMVNEPEIDFTEFDRADVVLAKNVIKQKIREAEKQLIYEEYCDKVDDMVLGTVETVEEKFVIVNIDKTLAMMKRSQQIPGEHYYEGQKLLVVISEVNRETKGAQVLVSRSTPVFVRRLFEKEVPEIYQGIIEIKAIAREAGERCKIAVTSYNENVDPIGACIGPRGQRVQSIINELHGEKIDIFEWSDNISDLIKNALSPSESVAVFPNDEVKDGLVVVVPDNQLSLAIGKKGKNARLAVKLTNHKIDIKSESEMQEMGIDYMARSREMQQEYEEQKARERAYKQQLHYEEQRKKESEIENVESADFIYNEDVDIEMDEQLASSHEDAKTLFEKEKLKKEETQLEDIIEIKEAEQVEEPVVEEPKEEDEMEKAARLAKEKRKAARAGQVKEYTSKFENFADASTKQEVKSKKKQDEPKKEEIKKKDDLEKQRQQFEQMRPIYSEEELAEIEEYEYEEDERWDEDVDYEEYDEYYD